jgi:hypothetical protein
VVVDDFDIAGVTVAKLKTDSPSCIDCHRPLSLSIALQRMQSDALEWAEIGQRLGNIQHQQQITPA